MTTKIPVCIICGISMPGANANRMYCAVHRMEREKERKARKNERQKQARGSAGLFVLDYSPLPSFSHNQMTWMTDDLHRALINDAVPIGAVFLGYDDRPRLVVNGPNGLKLELERNGEK